MKLLEWGAFFLRSPVLLFLGSAAQAEPFIHITTEDWAPFSYVSPSGEVLGESTAKVRAAFRLAGINHKITSYPWARAYHLALTRPNTAVYTIKRTPQREALFQWICPLQQPEMHYFFRRKQRHDIVINSVESAKKYRTGVTRNGFDQQYLVNHGFIKNTHFDVSINDSISLKKVLNGRLDLVMGTKEAIVLSLEKIGGSEQDVAVAWLVAPSVQHANCLAFGLKTEKSIVDQLRQALILVNARSVAGKDAVNAAALR